MTTANNLEITKRSIIGDTNGVDTLILYLVDPTNLFNTATFTISNPSRDDELALVRGAIVTPTLSVTLPAPAPTPMPSQDPSPVEASAVVDPSPVPTLA